MSSKGFRSISSKVPHYAVLTEPRSGPKLRIDVDDAVHPRVDRADVIMGAGRGKGDALRLALGAALDRVAAGDDRNVLFAVHLVDDRRGVRAEPGLELPQDVAGPGVERDEIAVRLAAQEEAARRHRRTTAA